MSVTPASQIFRSTVQSGSLYNASTTSSTTDITTKVTYAALTTGIRQFVPGTTSTATATIPAVGSAPTNAGWRMDTDIVSGEKVQVLAGSSNTVTIRLQQDSGTNLTVNCTVIVFLDGVEVGRGSSASAALNGTTAVNHGCAVSYPTTVTSATSNPRLSWEVYITATGTNLNALNSVNVSMIVNSGSVANGFAMPVNYVRSSSESGPTLPSTSSTRVVAQQRPASDAASTPSGSGLRAVSTNRLPSEGPFLPTTSALPTTNYHQIATDAASSSLDSVLSVQSDYRRASDLSNISTDDTARRVVTSRRALVDSMMTTDSVVKLVIYGRTVRYDFVPGDQPLIDPTRQVTGVIRNGDGTPYLGSATVYLVRDDNLVVASTLSSPTDGSYNFLRNSYDTSTYYVVAFTDGGFPMEGVTERGLVPS